MYSIIKNRGGALGGNHIIMSGNTAIGHIYFDSELPSECAEDFENKLSVIDELLEALEALLKEYQSLDVYRDTVDAEIKAEYAIAKARGES